MNTEFQRPRTPRIPGLRDSVPGAAYKKGDVIGGKYDVHGVLGAGGFGIVCLVYSRTHECVYALKTFRDEYLSDAPTRERFRKEASVWVDLGSHPHLVRAAFVDEVADRLYIAMEHIAPDEQGLNTLEGHLRHKPPDLAQSLRWAIQFCHGMEHAYSKGVRCHRDIKPSNIMIASDSAVRVTDFGLAGVIGVSRALSDLRTNQRQPAVCTSSETAGGTGFGTPEYMPPEQFTDAASCDERSDIYSFGVVLYQMAAEGRLPFSSPSRDFSAWHRVHANAVAPTPQSPMSSVIARCLEKQRQNRYQGFSEVRVALELLLKEQTGEAIVVPAQHEMDWWEWGNRGVSLARIGRHEDAVRCYDRVLAAAPQEKRTLNNKAVSLNDLGRYAQALECLDKALEIEPEDPGTLTNKSITLGHLGRHGDALEVVHRALAVAPRASAALISMGLCMGELGRYGEALRCYDRALAVNADDEKAWYNKGDLLARQRQYEMAIKCLDEALRINPVFAEAWYRKALCFAAQELHADELSCLRRTLELDPGNAEAWHIRGLTEDLLGRSDEAEVSFRRYLEVINDATGESARQARDWLSARDANTLNEKGALLLSERRYVDAIACFEKALDLSPDHAGALANKGYVLSQLGRNAEAISCFERAIAVNPRDAYSFYFKGVCHYKTRRYADALLCYRQAIAINPSGAVLWYNRALAEDELGMSADVISSLRRFQEVAPQDATTQLEYARKRLRELTGT